MAVLTGLLSPRSIGVGALGRTTGIAFPGRAAVERFAARGGRTALITVDLAPRSSGLPDWLRNSREAPTVHVGIRMGRTDEDGHDRDTAMVQFVHRLAREVVEDGHIVLGVTSHCEGQVKRSAWNEVNQSSSNRLIQERGRLSCSKGWVEGGLIM